MPTDDDQLTAILNELERLTAEVSALRQDVDAVRNGNCEPPKGRSTDLRW